MLCALQLEAGSDGVNTTKVAVVGGVSSGRTGGVEEDEVGRGQDDEEKKSSGHFLACLCLVVLRRGMMKWCASTEDVRTWWR